MLKALASASVSYFTILTPKTSSFFFTLTNLLFTPYYIKLNTLSLIQFKYYSFSLRINIYFFTFFPISTLCIITISLHQTHFFLNHHNPALVIIPPKKKKQKQKQKKHHRSQSYLIPKSNSQISTSTTKPKQKKQRSTQPQIQTNPIQKKQKKNPHNPQR